VSGRGTDFFISHAGRDTAWAEWLAWQLQQDEHPADGGPDAGAEADGSRCAGCVHGETVDRPVPARVVRVQRLARGVPLRRVSGHHGSARGSRCGSGTVPPL
jgi:hypothetical protein